MQPGNSPFPCRAAPAPGGHGGGLVWLTSQFPSGQQVPFTVRLLLLMRELRGSVPRAHDSLQPLASHDDPKKAQVASWLPFHRWQSWLLGGEGLVWGHGAGQCQQSQGPQSAPEPHLGWLQKVPRAGV